MSETLTLTDDANRGATLSRTPIIKQQLILTEFLALTQLILTGVFGFLEFSCAMASTTLSLTGFFALTQLSLTGILV